MKLPQVTLRELFLLVVIAATGCGWWVERGRVAESQSWKWKAQALEDILKSDGFTVDWVKDEVTAIAFDVTYVRKRQQFSP